MDSLMDEQVDKLIDGWMQMNGRMDKWVNGWMGGFIDEWMYE